MPKNKLSALLSLLLVFASGILAGAVAYRLYMVRTVAMAPPPPRPSPEEVRRRIVSEMRERVKLDDQQVQQLNLIYDSTRQQFDELHKKGSAESRAIWDRQKDQIQAMLRPDQVPLYLQYQQERDDMHRRHEQGGRGGRNSKGGPPPTR